MVTVQNSARSRSGVGIIDVLTNGKVRPWVTLPRAEPGRVPLLITRGGVYPFLYRNQTMAFQNILSRISGPLVAYCRTFLSTKSPVPDFIRQSELVARGWVKMPFVVFSRAVSQVQYWYCYFSIQHLINHFNVQGVSRCFIKETQSAYPRINEALCTRQLSNDFISVAEKRWVV